MNNAKGFTLVELVTVMVLVGILAIVAVAKFGELADKARDAVLDISYSEINTALHASVGNKGKFPTPSEFKTEVLDKVNFESGVSIMPGTVDDQNKKFTFTITGGGSAGVGRKMDCVYNFESPTSAYLSAGAKTNL